MPTPQEEEWDPYAGMLPMDALKLSTELANKRVAPPEEAAANRASNLYDLASFTPVLGNAISAYEAVGSGQDAAKSFSEGDVKGGAINTGLTALSTLGAAIGLPWGKAAKEAAKGASSRTNIFAGVGSKTADHAALDRAKKMAAEGADKDDIWLKEGWAEGKNGKWYYEISDDTAKSTPLARDTIMQDGTHTGRLDDVFEHPELEKAYPGTGATPTQLKRGDGSGTYWDRDAIDMQPFTPANTKRIALHELQHRTQAEEAFPPGAHPSDGVDKYYRTSGEVEARNVETRSAMTPDERRSLAPWYTEDVAPDDQIVSKLKPWQQKTFVIADDHPLADTAYALNARPAQAFGKLGGKQKNVHQATTLFFGADGQVLREVPDTDMTRVNRRWTGGDEAPLKDVVNHPKLFTARPELAEKPVKFFDIKEGNRPFARTNAETGNWETSTKFTDQWLTSQMAKLSQYEMGKTDNLAMALRHDPMATAGHIDDTLAAVGKLVKAEQIPAKHAHAYMDMLHRFKDKIASTVKEGTKVPESIGHPDPSKAEWLKKAGFSANNFPAPKEMQRALSMALDTRSAGNITARSVFDRMKGGKLPFESDVAANSQLVLPNTLDPAKLVDFVNRYAIHGGGQPSKLPKQTR